MNAKLSSLREYHVRIPCAGVELHGDVTIPAGAAGLVIFAHGSGSSRLSPRNRMVAGRMNRQNLATLLFDLLTASEAVEEELTGALRFDIPLLTDRLVAVIRWVQQDKILKHLGIGIFGASTGAAAALCAAARVPEAQAVVSRGGRTDLSGNDACGVLAPTLLIVGGNDRPVMKWNEETLHQLPGIKHLTRVADASHLFEEPGALEEVATTAASWFEHYLTGLE